MDKVPSQKLQDYGEDSKAWDWKDPIKLRNRFLRNVLIPIAFRRNSGTYVLHEKWDNLIILDACRFDTFAEVLRENGLSGRLESRISRGTNTAEFLLENFGRKKRHDDIIYISGNPFVTKLMRNRFFRTVAVWKEAWDNTNNTVLPEAIFRFAVDTSSKYPDKKLVIHFVQPHRPFVGYPKELWSGKAAKHRQLHVLTGSREEHLATTDRQTLVRLYRKNLELVFPYVAKLLELLPGNSVVTADHGEALGERMHRFIPLSVIGHPRGVRMQVLIKVPWLVVESPERKNNVPAQSASDKEVLTVAEEELINYRLKALGYA